MKKVILLIILCLFIISCNKKKEIVEYYPNGKIKYQYYLEDTLKVGEYKEYYENGNPKSIYIYENGIKQDSSIHYYESKKETVKAIKYWQNDNAYYQKDFFENGKLMRKGSLLRNNFRIGKWDLYSSENYKNEVLEYINVNNQPYLNQGWKLSKKGDTITGGAFFETKYKDTVLHNLPNRFYFSLRQRALLNSHFYLCLPKKGYYLNPDFSNQYEILYDTIENMSVKFKEHPIFKDRNFDILFDLVSEKSGNDTLRGFLLEKEITENNDSVDFYTRQFYFNIPYYIKEN